MNAQRTAAPTECTCTRRAAATLAETLGCPALWLHVRGNGWFHLLPLHTRADAAPKGIS